MNDLFHAWPHVIVSTWKSFGPVNAETVNDNLTDYGLSVVFMPVMLAVAITIYAAGTWVSECCRHCTCCEEDRKRCECDCCPKRCCSLLTFNRTRPQADVLAPGVIFGAIGVTIAILALAYEIKTTDAINSTTSTFLRLNDLSVQTKANLAAASVQMDYNSDLIFDLYLNATQQGVNATETRHVLNALVYTQFARDGLAEAYDNANVGLDITSTVDYIRYVTKSINIGLGVYLGLLIGMEIGTWLAAFLPDKPVYTVIVTFEAVKAAFLLIIAISVMAIGISALIVGGDICQDPNAYIDVRNTDTSNSDYISFYVNCPPGATSPQLNSLELALNSTLLAQDEMAQFTYYLQVNGSFPQLLSESIVIQAGLNVSVSQINTLIDQSSCTNAHNILVEGLTTGCHSVMANLAVWIFALPCTLFFLLFKDCVMPRAPYANEYQLVNQQQQPPPSPALRPRTRTGRS